MSSPNRALHLVDPGRPGRGEVHREPWMLVQPAVDRGGLVGGEVVADQMHVEVGGAALSMAIRNFLNSTARCWGCNAEITVPSVMSNAANRLVTPWRA